MSSTSNQTIIPSSSPVIHNSINLTPSIESIRRPPLRLTVPAFSPPALPTLPSLPSFSLPSFTAARISNTSRPPSLPPLAPSAALSTSPSSSGTPSTASSSSTTCGLGLTHPVPVYLSDTAKSLLCGTIAGVCGIVAGQPLDTIKVRMQVGSVAFSSPWAAGVQILKHEGFAGFFKGMLPPILGNAPINALLFAVEDRTSRYLEEEASEWSLRVRSLAAGGISGLSQVIISCPTELVKIQMQVQSDAKHTKFAGPWACTKAILKDSGVRALYRGLWVTIARDAPAFALYFFSYEECKSFFKTRAELKRAEEAATLSLPPPMTPIRDVDLGALPLMLSGGIAGVVSWFFLHPVDVCKSLIQSAPHDKPVTLVEAMSKAYKANGPGFLVRGIGATCLRAFPASAVIFLVYEWTTHLWASTVGHTHPQSHTHT